MRIRITTNAAEYAAVLDAVAKKQVPFATATGINRTLEEIQIEARRKLPTQFRFRGAKGKRLFEQLIHIGAADRARKDRLVGIVGIQDPQGKGFKGRSGILAKFEEAGVRRASGGGSPFAIPTSSFSQGRAIAQRYYPTSLGLNPRRAIEGGEKTRGLLVTSGGKYLLRGKLRTYAVDPVYHGQAPRRTWGVWQRRGRGRASEIFLLWVYRWELRHPKRISFRADATSLVKRRLWINIKGQMAYAQNEVKQARARLGEKAARAEKRI